MDGHIEGHLSSTANRACFISELLVGNNIPYECVLDWDFISQNNLSPCKDANLGNDILVGKHGATPIINSQSSTTADRAGVVELTPQSVQVDSPVGRLLCQFRFQGSTGVSLVESVMIPPRTEMLLEGKLAKRAKSHIGMIEPGSLAAAVLLNRDLV